MRHLSEKLKLKEYEFTDYKFKGKSSVSLRKRMRRAAKIGSKQYEIDHEINEEDENEDEK